MRVLVLTNSKFPPPPEHVKTMINGFAQWREQYRNKMEAFFFYAGRNAGGGILNVSDEAELNQIINDWPLTPYSDIDVIPIVDGDVALKQLQARVDRMMEMMG